MKRPHIILIVADQLRRDFLGKGFTPQIDTLLKESKVFSRAYCASPLCVPARGSFFTGTYPATNGSLINPWRGPDIPYGLVHKEIPDLYQLLEQAGYDCYHSGKQHLYREEGQPERDPSSRIHWLSTEKTYKTWLYEHGYPKPGGDYYRTLCPKLVSGKKTIAKSYSNPRTGLYEGPANAYFDIYFTDRLMEGLAVSYQGDKPLFVSAMFLAPHPPFCIPEPYYSMYTEAQVEMEDNVGVWAAKQSPLQLYQITGSIGNGYTKEEWRESWRVYAGLCTLLDDQVGRLIGWLKEHHLYDESIILFSSDHGEMLGSHQLFQKMCMYEEVSHIPLSLRLPHDGKHQRVDSCVSQVDILPTVLDLAGLAIPRTVQGHSLVPAMKGEMPVRKYAYLEFNGTDALGNYSRAVTDGRYKLVLDVFKDEIFPELYDLQEDSGEMRNLAFCEEYDKIGMELLSALKTHMVKTGDGLDFSGFSFDAIRTDYARIWR